MTTCTCGSARAPSSAWCQACTAVMENPCRRDRCLVGDELHADDDPRHDQRRKKAIRQSAYRRGRSKAC